MEGSPPPCPLIMSEPLRLNIGAGSIELPGFTPVDRKLGQEAFPLDYEDESVDEIYASHVLEHFTHSEVPQVLENWVAKLKVGGTLRIAVPDFEHIARLYLQGSADNLVYGYLYGGQTDGNDFHKAGFDHERLFYALRGAGLRNIKKWTSEVEDCARLPVSLNLQGTKPASMELPMTTAAMSTSRLGFTENMFCATQVFTARHINFIKYTGAYWGPGLERILTGVLEEDPVPEWIVTLDYDTVFDGRTFDELCYLMGSHPEADAIAPWQVKRECADLLTWITRDGKKVRALDRSELDDELLEVDTAHFGLTLLRTSALAKMAHPWFEDKPNSEGKWGDGRLDADIGFWHKWRAAGNTLFMASNVSIGHLQMVATWPDRNLTPIHQYLTDFQKHGPPGECRQ